MAKMVLMRPQVMAFCISSQFQLRRNLLPCLQTMKSCFHLSTTQGGPMPERISVNTLQGFSLWRPNSSGRRDFSIRATTQVNDSGSIDSPLIQSMEKKIKEDLNAESVIVKDAYGDGRHVRANGITNYGPAPRKQRSTCITSEGAGRSPLKFKHVGPKCYPALFLRSNRSLHMLLRRRLYAFSSRALVDAGSPVFVRNGQKDTTSLPLCWTAGANTVVSDQHQDPIRIWILTCWCFLTVGIMLGSWWAYHELGWGGWWFWDPVENASLMPWLLATACLHSVILPRLNSWTLFLNIVTFLSCVLGTFAIRSGLLASVHSFATDDTRGILLWWFFCLMTGMSMTLFSQMKQQASVHRTYKKEMVIARSTLVLVRKKKT